MIKFVGEEDLEHVMYFCPYEINTKTKQENEIIYAAFWLLSAFSLDLSRDHIVITILYFKLFINYHIIVENEIISLIILISLFVYFKLYSYY